MVTLLTLWRQFCQKMLWFLLQLFILNYKPRLPLKISRSPLYNDVKWRVNTCVVNTCLGFSLWFHPISEGRGQITEGLERQGLRREDTKHEEDAMIWWSLSSSSGSRLGSTERASLVSREKTAGGEPQEKRPKCDRCFRVLFCFSFPNQKLKALSGLCRSGKVGIRASLPWCSLEVISPSMIWWSSMIQTQISTAKQLCFNFLLCLAKLPYAWNGVSREASGCLEVFL